MCKIAEKMRSEAYFLHIFASRLIDIMKKILLLIAAVTSAAMIQAQEVTDNVYLTLAEAQEYAVENNKSLQNASIEIQRAQANKWKAIAAMLPQVKATVDYSNYFGYRMQLGQQSIAMPPFSTFGVNSAIGLNGAAIISAKVAQISKDMAEVTYKKNEMDIRENVKVLYYSALVSEQTLALLEDNLESMKKLHEITLSSVKVGVSEQTDADKLEVQVATMEDGVSATKRSIEMVYNSLKMALFLSDDTTIHLTQTIDDLVNLQTAADLMAEEFDINRNYDYQLLKESTDLARRQIALTGLTNGPTLTAYHQYSKKKYFSDEMTMNMTPPNMFGASLTIPIFTSGKTAADVKAAKLNYQKQLNTLEDTELALNVKHSQCIFNLNNAIDSYATQKQSVEVARKVFDNVAKKFKFGVASSLDVTNAATSLVTAQSNYVQALLNVVNAQVELEKLLNK